MDIDRSLGRDKAFKKQKLDTTKARRESLRDQRRQAELEGKQPRNDLLPALQVRQVLLSELLPSPHRTRRANANHIERLMSSISDLSFTVPIIMARLEIDDGHTRVEAAKRLGLDRVPAIEVSHLAEEDIRKLRLAPNRVSELGEWDIAVRRWEKLTGRQAVLTETGETFEEVVTRRLAGDAGTKPESTEE